MAAQKRRKNSRKKRRRGATYLILFLLLLLAGSGIFAGMRLRERRQSAEAAAAEVQAAAEAQRLQAAEDARLAEEAAKEQAAKEAAEAAAKQEEMDAAASILEEESLAGRAENAKVIQGAAKLAAPQVNAYSKSLFDAKAITAENTPAAKNLVVCIDPGHQREQIKEMEPNAPGSDVMKQGATSGTHGDTSGKDEFEIVLEVGLQLRDILEERGYTVVMTRESHEVSISNVERAQMATAAGADIFVRLHCNGVDDTSVSGVLCYMPSASNPYLTPEVIAESRRLATLLRDSQCAATGQRARDNLDGDDMTGINWATMPVAIVEMGFMTNPEEDLLMASAEGQHQIATGLANGVDAYFTN